MKVFILFEGFDYEAPVIVGVYSQKESAEQEASLREDPDHPARPWYRIKEYEVQP